MDAKKRRLRERSLRHMKPFQATGPYEGGKRPPYPPLVERRGRLRVHHAEIQRVEDHHRLAVLEAERSEMVCAISCNEDDSITSLTCTVARTGTLFEKFFGIPAGSSIAYLAGPPVESYFAVDSAIKISGTRLGMYFAPAETNCGGAILIGTQSQCAEAAKAYAEGIQWIADHPKCTNEGRR